MRVILLSFLFIFTSCGRASDDNVKVVNHIDSVFFRDDLSFKNMDIAIKRQKVYFSKVDLEKEFSFGYKKVKIRDLKNSLTAFEKIIARYKECRRRKSRCLKNLNKSIKSQFKAYRPSDVKKRIFVENKSLYTAYYSPDFIGSKTKTARFSLPIYKKPGSKSLQRLTREQIDFEKKLEGKGLELFYVDSNLYDLFLLHVEGGGRVQVGDKKYYLSYDTSNKQKFSMLTKYMIEKGLLTRDNLSTEAQKKVLKDNPQLVREIFASCPSYIFFKVSEDEPVGIGSIPLTSERSMAVDLKYYPYPGVISYVEALKPKLEGTVVKDEEFSRFFITQDTGGAIKGKARADLYFGFGPQAQLAANYLKTYGNQYFLLLKNI